MNGVDKTLEQDAFLFEDNIYEFSDDFIIFLTNPDIKYEDIGDEVEKRTTRKFLQDIRYNIVVFDEKSKRFKTKTRLFEVRRNRYLSRGLIAPTV